jgi:Sigma-70 region 2
MCFDDPGGGREPYHRATRMSLPVEELVQRHRPWIHNIAVRMLYHPQVAQDATQEILIKMLTRLSSFEGRSSFRTWLQQPGPAGQNREPWHRPERYNATVSRVRGLTFLSRRSRS